jgi:CheY-like chemotaxis protein
LIEQLQGPLTHAVRNAVDHGIESPEERATAGKQAEGTLRLELREEAEALLVQLEDDGRGIDRAAVRALLGEAARDLEDKDLLALLPRAGVSTRETATEISGRGIGLGAMAALADSLRGELTLTSPPGRGTTISVRLPRRLSLLDGLVVWAGDLPLVLPISAVRHIEPADERAPGPSLAARLGRPPGGRITHVVTLQGRDRLARLGIERLGAHTEVVQRPVGAHLGRVPLISGVTLLPNGMPAWIVDPRELVDACGPDSAPRDDGAGATRRILLVDDSRTLCAALRADLVRAGYDIVLADDGVTALDRIQVLRFDAVVSDVEMPRLDGFGLLQHCAGKLPVVLISSLSDEETASRARALGAAAFLVKDPSLGSRVESVLADLFSRNPERVP